MAMLSSFWLWFYIFNKCPFKHVWSISIGFIQYKQKIIPIDLGYARIGKKGKALVVWYSAAYIDWFLKS